VQGTHTDNDQCLPMGCTLSEDVLICGRHVERCTSNTLATSVVRVRVVGTGELAAKTKTGALLGSDVHTCHTRNTCVQSLMCLLVVCTVLRGTELVSKHKAVIDQLTRCCAVDVHASCAWSQL
jgi:hypothetical protein